MTILSNRVQLRLQVVGNFEAGINLRDEEGNMYNWFTKSYSSPLFYAVGDEWFNVKATLFTYDHPTPKKGLKNVRVLKDIK